MIGVNAFAGDSQRPKILEIKNSVEARQIRSLKKIRRERDNSRVEKSLSLLKDSARGTGNLLPAVMEAVESYATVGEIVKVFQDVFGESPMFGG